MKHLSFLIFWFVALTWGHASLITYNWSADFANGGFIPDNDVNGWQDTRTITDFQGGGSWQITDLNVTLNITDGFNGDLFGYLVHDSGFVVLLNQVGTSEGNPLGFSNPGMDVVLDQDAAINIHDAVSLGVLTGTYQPDSTYSPATSLTSFNGLDPNGSWTLYLQDMSFGDQSQVLGWGLQINAVPEPTTMALGIFGVLIGGGAIGRALIRRKQTMQQE